MRNIDGIIFHCSSSDCKSHDNIETIRKWHIDRNFDDVGYQYFIRTNGVIEIGRLDREIGAHCLGHNRDTIGICLHGLTEFTDEQFDSAAKLAINLMDAYNVDIEDVCAHNEFNENKTCPNFNMDKILGRVDDKIKQAGFKR